MRIATYNIFNALSTLLLSLHFVGCSPWTLVESDGASNDIPDVLDVRRIDVPLVSWLASRPHQWPKSLETHTAEAEQLARFRRAVEAVLQHDWKRAFEAMQGSDFELVGLRTNADLYILIQDASSRGRLPTIVLAQRPRNDLVLEAPHAGLESGTAEEAAILLERLGARAALVSGSHRCASRTTSACSGATRVCGTTERSPYPDSDVAHNPQTFFHAAHEILHDTWPSAIFVSLHGMLKTDDTVVITSDGSKNETDGTSSVSNQLRDYLRDELGGLPRRVVSCNDPNDKQYDYRKLCGFTNVQGRYANASTDICLENSYQSSQRFLHIEQTWYVLREFREGWRAISEYPYASAMIRSLDRVSRGKED